MSSVLREIGVGDCSSSTTASMQERKREAMLKRLKARDAQRKCDIQERRALTGDQTNEAQTNAFWSKLKELDEASAK